MCVIVIVVNDREPGDYVGRIITVRRRAITSVQTNTHSSTHIWHTEFLVNMCRNEIVIFGSFLVR